MNDKGFLSLLLSVFDVIIGQSGISSGRWKQGIQSLLISGTDDVEERGLLTLEVEPLSDNLLPLKETLDVIVSSVNCCSILELFESYKLGKNVDLKDALGAIGLSKVDLQVAVQL
jgi:hypothetical protein